MRKHIFGLAAGLFAMIVSSTTSWAAASDAGVVLAATGEATAKSADGATRKMDRRSPINVGDTLMTGTAATMQIRMKDGTVLALGEGSEFAVKSYSYKGAGDAKDSASLKLVKGTLMQVSGQMEKSAYSLETPVSTLGIRGTTFNISVNANGSVTATVNSGAVVSEAASAAVSEAKNAVATKLSAVTAAQKALKSAKLLGNAEEISKAQAALDAAQGELKTAQTTLSEAKVAVQTEIAAGNAAVTTVNGVSTPAPLQTFTATTPAALAALVAANNPDDAAAFVAIMIASFPDQADAITSSATKAAPGAAAAIKAASVAAVADATTAAAAAAAAADQGQGTSP
jgi:hypothetical protein